MVPSDEEGAGGAAGVVAVSSDAASMAIGEDAPAAALVTVDARPDVGELGGSRSDEGSVDSLAATARRASSGDSTR